MKNGTRTCARIGAALCALSLLNPLAAAQSPAPSGEAPTRVDLARPVEREIASGQSHDYVVEVPAGGYFHAEVEQKGIDVAVSVFDPAGAQLTEVDSLTGAESSESVSIIAKTAGVYRFAVHVGEGSDPPSGRYVVVASEPRPASAVDESRTSAEYASHRGLALWLEETDEGRIAALREYDAALASYTAAGDARGQADALSTLGAISNEISRFDDALRMWERELPIRTAIGDAVGEAVALNNVGIVHYQRSEFRQAQGYFEKALVIAKASGDKVSEAILRSRLGSILSALGRKKQSIAALSEALPLVHEHAGPVEEARLLLALGSAYYDVGDRKQALEFLERACTIWRRVVEAGIAPPAGEIEALLSVAAVYSDLGEREKALALFTQARDRAIAIDDRTGTSRAYDLIGQTMYQLGDNAAAIENYTKSLAAAKAGGFRSGELSALRNIGAAYAAMSDDVPGNTRRAVTYLSEAAAGLRATGNTPYLINTLVDLGSIYVRRRDLTRAATTLTRARALARSAGDRPREAIALKLLGDVAAARRDWRGALACYDESLPIAREARFVGGDATVLRGIARVERDRGRLGAAKAKIEEAIAIVESVRSRVGSSDYRASFFASARPYYDFYIDLLMRMHRREPSKGFDAEALRASERARARSLVELLSDAKADVRGGLDPALADRLATLRDELAAKTIAETRALAAGDDETLRGVRADVSALSDTYRIALDEARAASPRYAEVAQPTTLDLDRIRAEVLDADTALVEYFLGDERGYAWVVTKTSITSYTLPARARVEAAVRRARDVLVRASGHKRELALGSAPASSTTNTAHTSRVEREYLAAVAPLARMVLDPLARDLALPRVLVVADGALAYVPFGALPFGANGAKFPEPLIVAREVVYAPSASALAVMRHETAGRAPAPKLLALFADPVFDRADARVRKTDAPATGDDPLSSRSLVLASAAQSAKDVGFVGPSPFPRLPATRQEADAIAALAPESERVVALDFAASRDATANGRLAGYRIVHFATHGYLNAIRPELSGLVLSLCDENGEAVPGFLATPDVFDLKLDADLVVLSACETGLGKEVRGEGIVGLTRAFMYAGSPRVVVSLWSVSDRATAELMTGLYDGMLKKGLAPAAALRAAQLELYRQERWRAPYFWAPFVLQGEWR